jgi:hypothetical protein
VELSIRSLDPSDPAWNRLTLTGDGRTAFHCPSLVRAVAEAYGHRLTGFGAFNGSTMVGGIVVGDASTGHLRPLPMAAINGPLVHPSTSRHQSSRDRHSSRVIAALLQSVGGQRGAFVRMLPSTGDIREALATGWQATPTFTYEMELHQLKQTWDAMDGDRRRLVRRAERLGYHVTERRSGDGDSAHVVNELIRLHIAQQSFYGPVTPPIREAMRQIVDDLLASGCGRLFIARDADGSAVAMQFVVVWADHAANLFTGSSRSDADRGANTLLRWKAASHLHDDGVVRIDLNGARPGPAGRFKASLGADLVPRWDLHQPDRRPVALLQRATARARQELKSSWSRREVRS